MFLWVTFYVRQKEWLDEFWSWLWNNGVVLDAVMLFLWFKVFNATFNNISVISWRSVLFAEETGVPGENPRPVTFNWQTFSHNVVSCTPRHEQGCCFRAWDCFPIWEIDICDVSHASHITWLFSFLGSQCGKICVIMWKHCKKTQTISYELMINSNQDDYTNTVLSSCLFYSFTCDIKLKKNDCDRFKYSIYFSLNRID